MATIDINSVKIRENRQRKDLGDLSDLKTSLLRVGLINPIVIEMDKDDGLFYLIAGERRFTAWSQLVQEGKKPREIPCQVLSQLDDASKHLIELEENIKRKDLTWQEYCEAIDKMYSLKGCENNQELADYLGLSLSVVQRARQIWANKDNPKVLAADNMAAAMTICKRESARIMDAAQNDLDHILATTLSVGPLKDDLKKSTEQNIKTKPAGENNIPLNKGLPDASSNGGTSAQSSEVSTRGVIRCEDFISFAQTYSGKKFNLLHLDFPYGINHDRSEQGHTKDFGTYEDSEDTFKTLVNALLKNESRLIAQSAHVICWISLRYLEWTKEAFAKVGFSCHLQPFIWHKSDNKGILADVQCGMRNVGEYALIFNRGRLPVVKNISNIFDSPTTKRFHASEKPIPVLDYLFSAFVDDKTRLLDPTCGSGTAVISAIKAGAEEALGIELNKEFAEKAQEYLNVELERKNVQLDLTDFLKGV